MDAAEIDIQAVRAEARRQLDAEAFEAAVEAEKERLRRYRPWWHRVFPYRVILVRRNDDE